MITVTVTDAGLNVKYILVQHNHDGGGNRERGETHVDRVREGEREGVERGDRKEEKGT